MISSSSESEENSTGDYNDVCSISESENSRSTVTDIRYKLDKFDIDSVDCIIDVQDDYNDGYDYDSDHDDHDFWNQIFIKSKSLSIRVNSRAPGSVRSWRPAQTYHSLCIKGELERALRSIETKHAQTVTGWKANRRFRPHDNQPLHFAAAYGKLHVVSTLVEKFKCNPRCTNKDGVTTLHYACLGGHLSVVRYLVDVCNCDPNVNDKAHRSTPLHYACEYVGELPPSTRWMPSASKLSTDHDQFGVVKYLLQKNANPFKTNRRGNIPAILRLACKHESLEMVKSILEDANYQRSLAQSDFTAACSTRNFDIIKCFVEIGGCKVTSESIVSAFEHHDHKRLLVSADMYLVKNCESIKCHRKLMVYACKRSIVALVKLLIQVNCSIHKYASVHDILHQKVNKHQQLPLHIACENKYCDMELIELTSSAPDMDVNAIDSNGNTPLHIACELQSLEVIRYLVMKRHCFPCIQNKEGELPLHIVLKNRMYNKNFFGMVKMVSEDNVDINAHDKDGNTPLHIACSRFGSTMSFYDYSDHTQILEYTRKMKEYERQAVLDVVSYLTKDRHCNQSIVNTKKGDLALHIACRRGSLELVKLLRNCENIHARNEFGNTPLHIACKLLHRDIVEFFVLEKGCCSVQCPDKSIYADLLIHISCFEKNNTDLKILSAIATSDNVNVKFKVYDSNTPLHMACIHSNVPAAQFLTQNFQCTPVENAKGMFPLHIACTESLDTVKVLSINDCNVNVPSGDGNTPLHFALKYEKKDIVEYLTSQYKCDLNAKNKVGELPLHIACRNGSSWLKVVKIVSQCDVNCQTPSGQTPLHIACQIESLDIVTYLTEKQGVDINIPDKKGDTVLHVACRKGSLNIARYLIEECHSDALVEKFNENKKLPLHIACEKSLQLVKLVSANLSRNHLTTRTTTGLAPLQIACSHGLVEIAHHLIKDRGCEPKDSDSETESDVLRHACSLHCKKISQGAENVVKYLITECGCNPAQNDMTLFEHACDMKSVELMKALCVKSAYVNCIASDGNTPLHIACMKGSIDLVRCLMIELNCDHSIQNHKGELALHCACEQSLDIVELFDIHQTVDSKTNAGNTPLHVALYAGKFDIAKHLIVEGKCDVDMPDQFEDLPIHIACRLYYKYPSLKAELLPIITIMAKENDCKGITDCDRYGKSPLHDACKQGDISLLSIFVTPECINIVDSEGNTPLHIACLYRKLKVVKWLLNNGADNFSRNQAGDLPVHICIRNTNWKGVGNLFASDIRRTIAILKVLGNNHVSVQNNSGDTPVHIACKLNAIPIVCFLSQSNGFASVLSSANADGNLPLHLALNHKMFSKEIFDCISKCENRNADNKDGNTPLHIACKKRSNSKALTIVNALIEMGCNPNVVNKNGELPLHIAATHSLGLVRLFATSSDLVNAQDNSGNTPLHIACKHTRLNIMKYLLTETECKTDCANKHGELPLHLACQSKQRKYFESLASVKIPGIRFKSSRVPQINPTNVYYEALSLICTKTPEALINQRDQNGDTPLHIACRYATITEIEVILKHGNPTESITSANSRGELPFHNMIMQQTMCKIKILERFLGYTNDFDVNVQLKNGNTALHIACKRGQNAIIQFLIETLKCDVSLKNSEGDLALHIACRVTGNCIETVKLVAKDLTDSDINHQNHVGDTPLHIICSIHSGYGEYWERNVPIVEYLVERRCNTNILNNRQELPIYLACKYQSIAVVKQLFQLHTSTAVTKVTLNGDTVLHAACQNVLTKGEAILEYLFDNLQGILQIIDKANHDEELPLTVASRKMSVKAVEMLSKCDINHADKLGNTPLHEACKLNPSADVASFLLKHPNFNKCPNVLNCHGETPLHLASKANKLDVVIALLESNADPTIKDQNDETPIMLTTDLEVRKVLVTHGADSKDLYKIYHEFFKLFSSEKPPPTPVKVLVIGHSGVGKTTLVHSLKNTGNPKKKYKAVQFKHTAGIIPSNVNSKIYGNVTLYDFAGHPEFYASHGTILCNVLKSSPPIVLLLVNLTDKIPRIVDQLLYWIRFIGNYCSSLQDETHLIIVSSHVDELQERSEKLTRKLNAIKKAIRIELKGNATKLVLKSMFPIDCRQPSSMEFKKLCERLKTSSAVLCDNRVMEFSLHCFHAFLFQHFRHRCFVSLEYVISTIIRMSGLVFVHAKENPLSLIPTDPKTIHLQCQELSEKGHLIYLKNSDEIIKQSWLILDKDFLLRKVTKVLFSPPDFSEHHALSNSTGVVPLSKFEENFTDYNPSMLVDFLVHLEYCIEIHDSEVLKCLKIQEDDHSKRYFFFPSLVSVERPRNVLKDSQFSSRCGVVIKCSKRGDFFTTHCIQALLLRLTFAFTSEPTPVYVKSDFDDHTLPIKKVCSVWTSGICWKNGGVQILVDVIELNKVLVIIRCRDSLKRQIEYLKQRSSILFTIQKTTRELCPTIGTSVLFIHPDSIQHPLPPLEDIQTFTWHNIDRAISEWKSFIVNDDQEDVEVEKLLDFEPLAYLCKELTKLLYDTKNSHTKVSKSILSHLCDHFKTSEYCCKIITELLNHSSNAHRTRYTSPPCDVSDQLVKMFQKWQRRHGRGHGAILQLFNEVSVLHTLCLRPTGIYVRKDLLRN